MNSAWRWRKLAPWIAVGLLLLAFAVRTHALGRRELTFDEVGSVFIAERGPLGVLSYLRGAIREHPPFYYLMLSLWISLVGQSEFAVRLLSVGIGLATVAAMYRLARKLARPSFALLATLLLALSPFHVRVSHDARMYGLLALWSLLSLYTFVRLLDEDRARWWRAFWLVTGLGMFTHYYMAFVLLAEDIFLLLNWRRHRRLWVRWLIIHAVLGGAVITWAVLSPGLRATITSLWERGTASRVRWDALFRALNGLYLGTTRRPDWLYLSLPLLLTALGLGVAEWRGLKPSSAERQPSRHWGLMLGLTLLVPVGGVLAIPERVTGRYLAAALPAAVLAMSSAIGHMVNWTSSRRVVAHWAVRLLGIGALLGVAYVDIRGYPPIYAASGESFRAQMAYLRAHSHPDDGLLLHGPWQALLTTYYDAGGLAIHTIPLKELRVDPDLADAKLSEIFQAHERVWVIYDSVDPVDPDWLVARWLHKHAHRIWSQGEMTLYYAAPTQQLPQLLTEGRDDHTDPEANIAPSHVFLPLILRSDESSQAKGYARVERVGVRFGERLRLEGVALENLAPAGGDAILLLTKWRALAEISPETMLRLSLVGPTGEVWEIYQFDVGPPHAAPGGWREGETIVERRGLLVPIGAPPGDYTLRLRVFSEDEEEWTPEGEGPFELGPIHVQPAAPSEAAIEALPGDELISATFGEALSLVGYEPGGLRFTQGNPLTFDLYWQALTSAGKPYELGIRLIDDQGSTLTEKRVKPIGGWYPVDRWQTGDVILSHHAVPLPVDAPPGRYTVQLTVYAPDGSPLPLKGSRIEDILGRWERSRPLSESELTLFKAEVEARPRRYHPPAMDHNVDVTLGDDVRLLGYDLTLASVEPGGTVEITLYWKALRRMDRIYALFAHLVGPDETVAAKMDIWLGGGAYHTTQWLPGEVVEERYTISVPPDTTPGTYDLRIGVYNAANGERPVTTVDGTPVPERQVVLTTVKVEPEK